MADELSRLLPRLSEKQLLIYNAEISQYRKSSAVAYLLWFFFGGLGAHKFYLGSSLAGLFYLFCGIGLLVAFVVPPMFVMAIPITLLLFIDLFTIPGQAKDAERRGGLEIAKRLIASGQNKE